MKSAFAPRLVNGPSGDPLLFIDILQEKRALLCDLGQTITLSPAELLRVTDVFISHTHVDHFIGFDHLLRLHVGRGKRIRLFGPPGLRENVAGKLRGYTWNLVSGQRLAFEVLEIHEDHLLASTLRCRTGFRNDRTRRLERRGPIFVDPIFTVESATLDHHIPSLAYSIHERVRLNIVVEGLDRLGLRVGPWLNELKRRLREGYPLDEEMEVEGRVFPLGKLQEEAVICQPGRVITYVADCLDSPENRRRIVDLAKGSDILFCESAFLDADRERARLTCHLTAAQAGRIARLAGVKRLHIFHFSPKYEGSFHLLEEEAQRAFGGELLP